MSHAESAGSMSNRNARLKKTPADPIANDFPGDFESAKDRMRGPRFANDRSAHRRGLLESTAQTKAHQSRPDALERSLRDFVGARSG